MIGRQILQAPGGGEVHGSESVKINVTDTKSFTPMIKAPLTSSRLVRAPIISKRETPNAPVTKLIERFAGLPL